MTVAVKRAAPAPRLREFAKEAARTGFRLVGSATARFRPDPDFLLIGTKRGGTTSLYYDILKLPQSMPLFPSAKRLPKPNETKGIHFFDSNYSRGERWYRSTSPPAGLGGGRNAYSVRRSSSAKPLPTTSSIRSRPNVQRAWCPA